MAHVVGSQAIGHGLSSAPDRGVVESIASLPEPSDESRLVLHVGKVYSPMAH